METTRIPFNKNSEERRKRRTKFLFVLLLLFLLAVAAIVAFLRKSDLQITNVTVTGTKALDPQDISQRVKEYLLGNYLWVVPRSNTLLFSKQGTRSMLMTTFPGLREVNIHFINQSTIEVVVTERESDHVWCDTNNQCYFIDDTGVLYRESPQFSDGVYTYFSGSLLSNTSESETMIGSRFVTATDYERLLALYRELKKAGIGIYQITVTPERDVSVRNYLLKTYRVAPTTQLLVKLDDSPKLITSNLELLLADRGFINALIAKGGELETIDLRFPDKIFYKFKNVGSVDIKNSQEPVVPLETATQ